MDSEKGGKSSRKAYAAGFPIFEVPVRFPHLFRQRDSLRSRTPFPALFFHQ